MSWYGLWFPALLKQNLTNSPHKRPTNMEVFTIKEWEENFDELYKRVENGETIGIVKEDGTAAVMMPADDELIRIHTDHDDAS